MVVEAPTSGPNVTVATVVANLSFDMRTAALLTQGAFSCPVSEAPVGVA